MSVRKADQSRGYFRRSSGKQETSLEVQLAWAKEKSKNDGVPIQATYDDILFMQKHKLHTHKDIRLDDAITGANLQRPGLTELIREALANPSVSHIYAYKRDRLARPEDESDASSMEGKLSKKGIIIVYSNLVVHPDDKSLGTKMQRVYEYHESGKYLRDLAERVILSLKLNARKGFWNGGSAPYGFTRVLRNAEGVIIEKLPHGKQVKQSGCHIEIIPDDPEKIKVWVYILDLRYQGWGYARIARHLTEMGIPGPNAGRLRSAKNCGTHIIGEAWNTNTVADLCNNRAILAVMEWGRRSEGAHRRLDHDGHRELNDGDLNLSEKPRVICNPDSIRIRSTAAYEPLFDHVKWDHIQKQAQERARSQRGIPRHKDPSKYPLSCRVFDLTDDCGWPMYGVTNDGKAQYICGRYQKTARAECNHNHIDGEALLESTLSFIRDVVSQNGGRDKIYALLKKKSKALVQEVSDPSIEHVNRLNAKIAALENEKGRIVRLMIREKDSLFEALEIEFRRVEHELLNTKAMLQEEERNAPMRPAESPDSVLADATALLDNIIEITEDKSARSKILKVIEHMGLRIGLNFKQELYGKRKLRRLLGGTWFLNNHELPVPLYGGKSIDNQAQINVRSNTQSKTLNDACLGDNASMRVLEEGNQREEVSCTMGNRGERI